MIRSPRSAYAQKGAVLLWGLGLIGVASIALMAYFHLSLIASHKVRQQLATDAAAYSGALAQSRVLNLLAFVNRAHLGQQVALAHLLTMASWHQSGLAQQSRLRQGNPPLHLLALFFGPQAAQAYSASSGLFTSDQGALLKAVETHQAAIQNVLVQLQQDIQRSAQAERDHTIRAVYQANFPEFNPADWTLEIVDKSFPGAWRPSHSAPRHVLEGLQHLQTLYPFLSSRDQTKSSSWVVDSRCPWRRHELRKRGGTQLNSAGFWTATDTQSLHALRSNRWVGCYSREYPMAWAWINQEPGAIYPDTHQDNAPDNFADDSFWSWVGKHTEWDIFSGSSNALANSWAVRDQPYISPQAVPGLLEIESTRPLSFGVRIRMQARGRQQVYTHSAAQSYYRRPWAKVLTSSETPHVYHAFWQARLSPDAVEVVR